MADAWSPADLALFADLDRATRAAGTTPCLIGAGALQLGPGLRWGVRLARRTRDWDFAVRAASWDEYHALAERLIAAEGGFARGGVPHRFQHDEGSTLDVVPYGALEHPPGTVRWSDGMEMDTCGLSVLDEHHERHRLAHLELRVASLPALVGLKVLAYRGRRPGVTRDIGDVHDVLRDVEAAVPEARILAECLPRLEAGEIGIGEVGAYLLGRDVGRIFERDAREHMLPVLLVAGRANEQAVADALRAASARSGSAELVAARLHAFAVGIADR